MRTPAGKECKYFYGDYHRGRSKEECRLVGSQWNPKLCTTCPVPQITQANACEYLRLNAEVKKVFFILNPHVTVKASCTKCQCAVAEPEIGCGQCHPLPPFFTEES